MNYWNRALCSVIRRRGKSIILFAVIFILGNVIAGAIAIQQSTDNVEKKIKNQLGAAVTAEMDMDKLMKANESGSEMKTPEPLKEETIKKIGESPYVKEYDYSISGYLGLKSFKTYQMEKDSNTIVSGLSGNNLFLKGTNSNEPSDFKDKKVKLTEGRLFTKEDKASDKLLAVISKTVADENGINVGDQVIWDSQYMKPKEDGSTETYDSQKHSVEIIGIFEPLVAEKKKEDGEKSNPNQSFLDMEQFNTVYMTNNGVREINKAEFERGKELDPDAFKEANDAEQITPMYTLKSPEDVEAFKQESEPLLPEDYKMNASTDEFDKVGGSVKKMSQISGYVVILAIAAALLIISLVVILFLRDRKHELGIYLSLGEKRKLVMAQVVIELLLISAIAMCASLITGNVLGKLVSESLIASDALAQAEPVSSGAIIVGGSSLSSNLSTGDITNAYEVKFSLSYILTFLLAGLTTVLLSAILPLTYVMRLNPKKIMM
ncbi:FtsX-like permease family protein [Enterococcus rivorum]|uniref:ABC transporter permease n=2 Tax=Enterococcus rivorum TaxID=762845 RepID=A0A1E5L1M5_9ENTE|nr:ABC transporter permease [Enterococcus rivorum]MBP2098750.1 putative ABC transport system permease protein [Enterococcus rivorum]OEH83941.1 ABC transporter permease [Enterococcus rivorum]